MPVEVNEWKCRGVQKCVSVCRCAHMQSRSCRISNLVQFLHRDRQRYLLLLLYPTTCANGQKNVEHEVNRLPEPVSRDQWSPASFESPLNPANLTLHVLILATQISHTKQQCALFWWLLPSSNVDASSLAPLISGVLLRRMVKTSEGV